MKIRTLLILICWNFGFIVCSAQNDNCSQLGVWVWHIEQTGMTHAQLANNLSNRGIQRAFVKVADGTNNPDNWPEVTDRQLVSDYKDEGLSIWGWSYNYPTSDFNLQAEALYQAAATGYDGFIVDVEMEFDNKPQALDDLFSAFNEAKLRAIEDGHTTSDFQLYCTTWGNPKDHLFSISSIDPYVDGFMPQTYVEFWGPSFVSDISFWIEEGNKEYAELGATKPIHHIVSTVTGVMTSDLIDEFIEASGAETSIWRVPGSSVPISVWEDWNEVNWSRSFCMPSSTNSILTQKDNITIYPNPTSGMLYLNRPVSGYIILNLFGREVLKSNQMIDFIDLSSLQTGLYLLQINNSHNTIKIIMQ